MDAMLKNSIDRLMQTFTNPNRSGIFYELMRHGECSATDLSKILKQKVNNIYYHLQILEDNGIVNPPRTVVKRNYIEKYYSLSRKFLANINVDEYKWKQSQKKLPIEQRREIAMAGLNVATSMLRWRMEEYKRMSKEQIDKLWGAEEEWLTLLTFTREQYKTLVRRLQKTWVETIKEFDNRYSEGTKPYTILIAALSSRPQMDQKAT